MRSRALGLSALLLAFMMGCSSESGDSDANTAAGNNGNDSSQRPDESGGDDGASTIGSSGGDDYAGAGLSDPPGANGGAAPGAIADDSLNRDVGDHAEENPDTDVVANPFVDASKDPFSTFAADVDTASYDYFRQSLEYYDVLPEPRYVRIEDFVNYFAYDYPTPAYESDVPFSISLASAPHPFGRTTRLVRVGIQAKAPPVEEKKPANLVFLVDTSGSMASQDKLPLVKVILKEALNVLAPTDKVSIVTYAGDVSVRLEPTPVEKAATIRREIDALEAGGGTAGESGIHLAYQQAEAGFIKGGINHVILCTDGDFNIGISDADQLVALIKSKRETGVTLTALGFGRDNLADNMMEKVSNAGNGMYSVVYSHDMAIKYANERMLSTLVHVAKDMKIQVEWNPERIKAYRLIGYENRAVADDDFRNDTVDGGEVGANHRVTALYEVVLAGEEVPMPEGAPALDEGEPSDLTPEIEENEYVRVKVRYKAPDATDADRADEVVAALDTDHTELTGTPQKDFAWAAAVATFAEILRESPYASLSELDAIAKVVNGQKDRDADRSEFVALFTKARPKLQTEP